MIKTLGVEDFEEFCRVRLKSLEEYPVAYSSMPQFFKDASLEMKMNLLSDSEGESSNFINGYYKENKLIGLIGFRRESRDSVAHKGTIWGFYVSADFQEQSIGKALLNSLIKKVSSDKDIKYIRLMVAENCERAISLFKSFEFKEYGMEIDSISDGVYFYNQIYMQKFIEEVI